MKTLFTNNQMSNIRALFSSDIEYKKHLNNLWKTRRALVKIIEIRPELKEDIRPQFDTLNNLIAALLPQRPADYPPYNTPGYEK